MLLIIFSISKVVLGKRIMKSPLLSYKVLTKVGELNLDHGFMANSHMHISSINSSDWRYMSI